MQDTWDENQHLMTGINVCMKEAARKQKEWEEARQMAADALGEICRIMIMQAQKIYGEHGIRAEPILAGDELSGIKIWVQGTCHIYKTKGAANEQPVALDQTEAGSGETGTTTTP